MGVKFKKVLWGELVIKLSLVLISFLMISCTSSRAPQNSGQTSLLSVTENQQKNVVLHPLCSNQSKIEQLKPSKVLSSGQVIDLVLVSKTKKKTYLFSGDQLIYAFDSAFGGGANKGAKVKEGDERTPEGIYQINGKNSQSKYHLALRISYPNQADIEYAEKNNVPVGGDIMFHGLPNGYDEKETLIGAVLNNFNWTAGCVAMKNQDIRTMYKTVRIGTTVAICPKQ